MLAAFVYSARLYFTLCLQSLRRRQDLGRLTLKGRVLRLCLFVAALPIWLIHWLALLLDELFFPGYRKVQLRRPVFILGVPRSGTTYLHRTLAADETQFTSVSTWEVFLAPAIVQKKFWAGLAAIDRWLGGFAARLLGSLERKLFAGLEGIHDVSLESAEEDYLLLLPLMSCFILFLPFPESRHIWNLSRFDWDMPQRDREIILRFYRACLQKHQYCSGDGRCYLSKNAAFASWPESLQATFPDARFVICMREPHKAVPSLLGSLREAATFFQLRLDGGQLPEMLLQMMQDYYRHLLSFAGEAVPLVAMNELKQDPVAVVRRLYADFGLELELEYLACLKQIEAEARGFRTRTPAASPWEDGHEDFYRRRFPDYYLQTGAAAVAPRPSTSMTDA